MTSYGPGLLDLIPDADVLEGDPTGGDGIAWLLELAAIGLSRRWRSSTARPPSCSASSSSAVRTT
ncbi:hypothetical protein [Dactylosporangium sp. NPDC050588]|uniref:hypothetical protein n=1 Tax=Dactylosporangium sp. NPDC050588 TaxID=3157211 RepID=UPI0033DF318A